MKRNVYKFVVCDNPFKVDGQHDLLLNGNKVGGYWPDIDGWKASFDKGRSSLTYWYCGRHSGFAYNEECAKRIMLDLAKREVQRVRKARYRK